MAEPRRILAVKLAGIGDLLTALPALYALRERFPEARLELLTTPGAAELARHLSLFDGVISFDKYLYDRPQEAFHPGRVIAPLWLALRLIRPGYDILVLFHHLTTRWGALKFASLALAARAPVRVGLDNERGWFLTARVPDRGFGARHEVEYALETVAMLGARPRGEPKLEVEFAEGVEERAAGGLVRVLGEEALVGPQLRVILHPGGGAYAPLRRWEAARFAALADALNREFGARILLVAGPQERELAEEVRRAMAVPAVNLAGRLSLVEVAVLMKRCQLFVGADSGLMHLAGAMGLPLLAIFGPTNHLAWGPYRGRCRILRVELACSPCLYVGHRVGDTKTCQRGLACLKEVNLEMALGAARELLG